MIDHVTIRVAELEASTEFYALALGLLDAAEPTVGDDFLEWNDFSIAPAGAGRPRTRRLHLGFQASSRETVTDWWHAMTAAGHPDDGIPGPRPEYGPTYFGAFVTDPDGNSVEAVHNRPARDDGTLLDHLWIRVADLAASTRFYEAIAPTVGYAVERLPDRTRIHGDGASVSVLAGELTESVHLAFSADGTEVVRAFHAAGVSAGFESLGNPGERPEYHAGYFGAYLADPDGNNIEAVFHDR